MTARRAPLVAVDGVVVHRDRFTLHCPSLHLAGGVTAVLGPNGSGKSTLLRVLATTVQADAGSLAVDGARPTVDGVCQPADRQAVRRALGYLPQRDTVADRRRVFDHLDEIAIVRELAADQRTRAGLVASALRIVELTDRAGVRCGQLSGGERRRVALAAALMGTPPLLILDEPDAGLDDHQRDTLAAHLRSMAPESTVIVATHHRPWVLTLADRVVEVSSGDVRLVA